MRYGLERQRERERERPATLTIDVRRHVIVVVQLTDDETSNTSQQQQQQHPSSNENRFANQALVRGRGSNILEEFLYSNNGLLTDAALINKIAMF